MEPIKPLPNTEEWFRQSVGTFWRESSQTPGVPGASDPGSQAPDFLEPLIQEVRGLSSAFLRSRVILMVPGQEPYLKNH